MSHADSPVEPRDVVADFWRGIDVHDWDLVASTLADDFVRIGMRDDEADTAVGKETYLRFVTDVIGRTDTHGLDTLRIFYSPDRRLAVAETIERIDYPEDGHLAMRFANVMELNEDGLISKLDIFWKTPERMPPSWIAVEAILGDDD